MEILKMNNGGERRRLISSEDRISISAPPLVNKKENKMDKEGE